MKYWNTIILSFDCYDYDFKLYKDSALPKLAPEAKFSFDIILLR